MWNKCDTNAGKEFICVCDNGWGGDQCQTALKPCPKGNECIGFMGSDCQSGYCRPMGKWCHEYDDNTCPDPVNQVSSLKLLIPLWVILFSF